MVENNTNCYKCNSQFLYVEETKNMSGFDFKLSPFYYKATNDTPQEVRYDENISKHKWFCKYCIPLFEKEYRGSNCSIERHQSYKHDLKNPHTGKDMWMTTGDWTTLKWKDTDKWDDQVKSG